MLLAYLYFAMVTCIRYCPRDILRYEPTRFAILLFAVLLLSVSSVSYVKKASAASECPSGQIKDWAGICIKER
jgi:hypothetical protein